MTNEWDVEKFSAVQIDENMRSRKFLVPRYQRGIVWTDKQRADLVDTIKKGLPFGTLLLYRDENSYQIIDGLQRSTAIIKFVQNPAQFFDEEDIDIGVIRRIVQLIGTQGNIEAQEQKVKGLLQKWVKEEHKTLSAVESMQFPKFGRIIANEFPTCVGKEFDIGDMIAPMMQNYIKICKKISDTRIPAIVLTGDSDLLPVLFERINSKGTQLSKYQIYAATWIDKKYRLDDSLSDIVKINRDRYDVMLEESGSLDDYDSQSFVLQKELNAFEIAFGFGKYLCQKWPHLFGSSKSDTQVESIGFTLITCCLGLKNKNAKNLSTVLADIVGEAKINLFLHAILDAVKITDKAVGKYSKFKSNTHVKTGERPLHTEFQIVSIIASVFLMKYATIERDDEENIINLQYAFDSANIAWTHQQKKRFSQNVGKIYIMEILQQRWSGSGDKKMDAVLENPEYYTRETAWDEFEKVLNTWFDTLNHDRNEYRRIATPKEPELVIIAALYLKNFTAAQQMDGSHYDIEHLAPQAMMKKHLARFDGQLRLPVSSIGNICLLPECANRSKRDKTLYMDQAYLAKAGISLQEIEQKYSFTEKSDLDWILDTSSTPEELEQCYMRFINNRFTKIKEQLHENFVAL